MQVETLPSQAGSSLLVPAHYIDDINVMKKRHFRQPLASGERGHDLVPLPLQVLGVTI